MPLQLPAFKQLRPFRMKRLAQQIAAEERSSEADFSSDRVEKALQKLTKGQPLRRQDLKILCFHVGQIFEKNLFNLFINKIYTFFKNNKNYSSHLRGLLVSYYDDYKNNNLFIVLKYGFINIKNIRPILIPIKNIIKSSNDCEQFIINLYQQIKSCQSINEIEELNSINLIGKNKHIYAVLLSELVKHRIKNINSNEVADFVLEIMTEINNINILKPIFEMYLLSFEHKQYLDNLDNYLENIFQFIYQCMGEPYGVGKIKWLGINPSAVDIFTMWLTQKNINHYFGDIAGDIERLNYWKKYSHYFLRVSYFGKYDGAILMESREHMFVEFTHIGAMYMYRKSIKSIEHVEQYYTQYSATQSISKLKDKELSEERMEHRGRWQDNFANTLSNYGYEMKGYTYGV